MIESLTMAEEARQRDNPHYKRKTLNLFGFLHYRNGCGSVGKKKSKEKADTSVNLNPFLNCKVSHSHHTSPPSMEAERLSPCIQQTLGQD